MKLEIRKRKIEDSKELAHAIAVIWNTTYKEIVDEDFFIELFDFTVCTYYFLKTMLISFFIFLLFA